MLTGPFSVTPTERTTPTLPAVSPVPLLQRVPAVVTIVVLSRLIGAAATVGRCGGGLGESGAGIEGGQGQSGDEHFHSTSPCYGPSSVALCISGGPSAGACRCASPSGCACRCLLLRLLKSSESRRSGLHLHAEVKKLSSCFKRRCRSPVTSSRIGEVVPCSRTFSGLVTRSRRGSSSQRRQRTAASAIMLVESALGVTILASRFS